MLVRKTYFVLPDTVDTTHEVSSAASNPMTPGLDWGAYPKSKVFTFGLDIQF